jgi:hypothetical protein
MAAGGVRSEKQADGGQNAGQAREPTRLREWGDHSYEPTPRGCAKQAELATVDGLILTILVSSSVSSASAIMV